MFQLEETVECKFQNNICGTFKNRDRVVMSREERASPQVIDYMGRDVRDMLSRAFQLF